MPSPSSCSPTGRSNEKLWTDYASRAAQFWTLRFDLRRHGDTEVAADHDDELVFEHRRLRKGGDNAVPWIQELDRPLRLAEVDHPALAEEDLKLQSAHRGILLHLLGVTHKRPMGAYSTYLDRSSSFTTSASTRCT